MAKHIHLLVRAEIRCPLVTRGAAATFLRDAISLAGMNIISGPHAVYGTVPGNEGVSATALLDFSSATLHEWPHREGEPPLLQFDLYTCGPIEPTLELFRPLLQPLQPMSLTVLAIDRDEMRVHRWSHEVSWHRTADDRWVPDAIR